MTQCSIRLLGSDSIDHKIDLEVIPRVGEILFILGTKNIIHSVEHIIDIETKEHEVQISYKSAQDS